VRIRARQSRSSGGSATASLLTDGKFTLGVGTGEALNEDVTGAKWPPAEERQEMLEEAVTIITGLLTGEQLTHAGQHYQVDTARLYSVPRVPPPVYVSGFGEKSARLAARIADGYICMGPQAGGARDSRGVPQVARYLRTTRATARLRAAADSAAACCETASPTAASTVACEVRKSLAVKSPPAASRR
jgi:G6PDH family F420-dependent oxidoreductase